MKITFIASWLSLTFAFNSFVGEKNHSTRRAKPGTRDTVLLNEDLVIIRPFCNKDYRRLLASFDQWNEFPPCTAEDENRYHLVLSYSRDLDLGYGRSHIWPLLEEFRESFQEGRELWHRCISTLEFHSARIPNSIDIYRPDEYQENPNWVNGPNFQFLAITEWFQHLHQRHYNLWFLMELDTVPVKPGFLTRLSEEISHERPFAILGSHYRGDRWDLMMEEISPSLKYHINGNAVYNLTHPIYQILVSQLTAEKQGVYRRFPYDYRISQIIYENDLVFDFALKWNEDASFYKGWSKTIANYASTNLAKEFLGDESLVHGGRFHQLYSGSLGLVVSDWGQGELTAFHEAIISADHPFTEIIYVVPFHMLPPDQERVQRLEGVRNQLTIRYVARDSPNLKRYPDYLDHCRFQPEQAKYFMVTNTYMRPTTPFSLYQVEDRILVSYVAANSETCRESPECQLILEEARESTDFPINITVASMSTIYHRDHLGTLEQSDVYRLDDGIGYCQTWLDYYLEKVGDFNESCRPFPGPTGTGYYAYVEKQVGPSNHYYFSNLLYYGSREAFLPRMNPPKTNNLCPLVESTRDIKSIRDIKSTRGRVGFIESALMENFWGSFTHWFGWSQGKMMELKEYTVSDYKLECFGIANDAEKCNEIPHCWWRPGFNRCLPIIDPTFNLSVGVLDFGKVNHNGDEHQDGHLSRHRRGLALDFRQAPNYPSSPHPPCDCDDGWKPFGISCIPIISVLGGLLLLSLLGLLGLLGLLATSWGLAKVIGAATAINGFFGWFGSRMAVGAPELIQTEIMYSTIIPDVHSAVVPSGPQILHTPNMGFPMPPPSVGPLGGTGLFGGTGLPPMPPPAPVNTPII